MNLSYVFRLNFLTSLIDLSNFESRVIFKKLKDLTV